MALKLCKPSIRVVHVDKDSTTDKLKKHIKAGYSSLLMLDSKGGGTGKKFDHKLATELSKDTPFLLAGGLTPVNVGDAVQSVHPLGVDACGGLEKDGQKGVKDLNKIAKYVQAGHS
mmetsp:Transcript_12860/g.26274  ORF Transcript_12860/g.26274 Transcript_12860/m.26274 type:complete len:116 (-) Transcript_12860:521-868(-)